MPIAADRSETRWDRQDRRLGRRRVRGCAAEARSSGLHRPTMLIPALVVLAMIAAACGATAGQPVGPGLPDPGAPGAASATAAIPSFGRPATSLPDASEPPAASGAVPSASDIGGGALASATPGLTGPGSTPIPTPSVQALAGVALTVSLGVDPEAWFAHQQTKTWCAPSAVQMTLAALGLADTSAAFQAALQARIGLWTSRSDSLNGGWGPDAMARALEASGAHGYQVRTFPTRAAALADAARAIMTTSSPVILLAWRGAHAWVMTGFRATADPLRFPGAEIQGAFILDPWYPWVSTIWGPSDPAGAYQDAAEMRRNFLPWKRPEGRYPDRDGMFVTVVPTVPVAGDE